MIKKWQKGKAVKKTVRGKMARGKMARGKQHGGKQGLTSNWKKTVKQLERNEGQTARWRGKRKEYGGEGGKGEGQKGEGREGVG